MTTRSPLILTFAACALCLFVGCASPLKQQLAELATARAAGTITEAQYLDLKQRAQQADGQRRATIGAGLLANPRY